MCCLNMCVTYVCFIAIIQPLVIPDENYDISYVSGNIYKVWKNKILLHLGCISTSFFTYMNFK